MDALISSDIDKNIIIRNYLTNKGQYQEFQLYKYSYNDTFVDYVTKIDKLRDKAGSGDYGTDVIISPIWDYGKRQWYLKVYEYTEGEIEPREEPLLIEQEEPEQPIEKLTKLQKEKIAQEQIKTRKALVELYLAEMKLLQEKRKTAVDQKNSNMQDAIYYKNAGRRHEEALKLIFIEEKIQEISNIDKEINRLQKRIDSTNINI